MAVMEIWKNKKKCLAENICQVRRLAFRFFFPFSFTQIHYQSELLEHQNSQFFFIHLEK